VVWRKVLDVIETALRLPTRTLFPSRLRLEGELKIVSWSELKPHIDVFEADGKARTGLLVGNNPINEIDPLGLRVTWWGAFRDDDVPVCERSCYNACVQRMDVIPTLAGIAGGFGTGFAAGAVIGSVAPGLGTAAGGVISGVIGAVGSVAGTYQAALAIDHVCKDKCRSQ